MYATDPVDKSILTPESAVDTRGKMDERDTFVTVENGRTIAARVIGPEYGVPILTLHGNPGSRLGPHVGLSSLEKLGVILIAPDRPGYGLSDRHEDRDIADTAKDMSKLMDALGIERFGIIARSGGTPHALGCAALMGERVFGTVLFASLAPKTASIEWVKGMTKDNQEKHAAALIDQKKLMRSIYLHAQLIRRDSEHIVHMLWPDLHAYDKDALIAELSDERTRTELVRAQCEGFRQRGIGWFDDTLALHREWGFDVQSVTSPVTLWHGKHDPFASVAHSRWLAAELPNATLIENPDTSHMSSYLYNHEGLRVLRGLFLGAEGQKTLHDKITHVQQETYGEFGVTEESPTEPAPVCNDSFDGIVFSDEYMRRRVADIVISMRLPSIVQRVLDDL